MVPFVAQSRLNVCLLHFWSIGSFDGRLPTDDAADTVTSIKIEFNDNASSSRNRPMGNVLYSESQAYELRNISSKKVA